MICRKLSLHSWSIVWQTPVNLSKYRATCKKTEHHISGYINIRDHRKSCENLSGQIQWCTAEFHELCGISRFNSVQHLKFAICIQERWYLFHHNKQRISSWISRRCRHFNLNHLYPTLQYEYSWEYFNSLVQYTGYNNSKHY